MSDHVIAREDDFEDGGPIVAEIEGREIGVFRIDGEYQAYLNWCPHQAAPVCEGRTHGQWEASFDRDTLETSKSWREDKPVLNCPWHGWQFDLNTGTCLSDGDISLPTYPVRAEDGDIIVSV
jgi:nitrite reductase (NADH) small subunit